MGGLVGGESKRWTKAPHTIAKKKLHTPLLTRLWQEPGTWYPPPPPTIPISDKIRVQGSRRVQGSHLYRRGQGHMWKLPLHQVLRSLPYSSLIIVRPARLCLHVGIRSMPSMRGGCRRHGADPVIVSIQVATWLVWFYFLLGTWTWSDEVACS